MIVSFYQLCHATMLQSLEMHNFSIFKYEEGRKLLTNLWGKYLVKSPFRAGVPEY